MESPTIEFKNELLTYDQKLLLQAILFVEENPNVPVKRLIKNCEQACREASENYSMTDDEEFKMMEQTAMWYADLAITLEKIKRINESKSISGKHH